MKDIKGIEIKIGQYVFYFRNRAGRIGVEEAEVVGVSDRSIKLEFYGNNKYGKKKGQRSNVFNTTSYIFILNKDHEKERRALVSQILELRRALVSQIQELTRENKGLRAEVEKIHSRFDILDL